MKKIAATVKSWFSLSPPLPQPIAPRFSPDIDSDIDIQHRPVIRYDIKKRDIEIDQHSEGFLRWNVFIRKRIIKEFTETYQYFEHDSIIENEVVKYIYLALKFFVITENAIFCGLIYLKRFNKKINERGRSSQLLTEFKRKYGIVTECMDLYDMVLVATLLGSKYLEDIPYNNKTFHHLSDFTLEYINDLERLFLQCLGYEMFISETEFKIERNKS